MSLHLGMTYETISVRMNRSDRNIRWGFSVRQQADGLVIDRVDADSLSDKAGVKHNDKVEQINGRLTRGLDANTANRLIDDSFNEVRLSLQRFVTSHTTLPWTLSEKDNKMIVEEARPGFGSGFGATTHFNNFNKTSSNFGNGGFNSNQNHNSNYNQNNSTTTRNSQSTNSSSFQQHHTTPSNNFSPRTTVIPVQHPSTPNKNHYQHQNNGNINSTTNFINQSNYNSTPQGFSNGGNRHGEIIGRDRGVQWTKPISPIPPPSSYSFNNGATNQLYGTGSGGVPLNQLTYVNTTGTGGNGLSSQGLSPGKVFYHSPSNRSRNDLSPGASIHHLQYNSPMNLYSSEAVAEQYFQQTGQNPEGPPLPNDKRPAYLTSEAKKLIEEEARGRFNRGKSPSSQSSCFKRISHAVGADY